MSDSQTNSSITHKSERRRLHMDQTPANLEPSPPVPQAPGSSLLARLMNVFAAPGEVFDEAKASQPSTANWLVPTVLLALFGVFSALLISSQPAVKRQKQAMQEAMFQKFVESGKMTQEAADNAVRAAEAAGGKGQVYEGVGVTIVSFISLFWSALIVWLGGFVMKGRFGYKRALEIVGLAGMIALLGVVLKTLLILTTGNMFASLTPGLFVKDFNPMSNTLHGILAAFDVIWFWALGVQACGLARFSGASHGKAAVWVFGVWLAFMSAMMTIGIVIRRLMGF